MQEKSFVRSLAWNLATIDHFQVCSPALNLESQLLSDKITMMRSKLNEKF